jgi:hypothetical protein
MHKPHFFGMKTEGENNSNLAQFRFLGIRSPPKIRLKPTLLSNIPEMRG